MFEWYTSGASHLTCPSPKSTFDPPLCTRVQAQKQVAPPAKRPRLPTGGPALQRSYSATRIFCDGEAIADSLLPTKPATTADPIPGGTPMLKPCP